jgi:hypothetical protein
LIVSGKPACRSPLCISCLLQLVAAGPAAGWPPEAAVEVAGSLPEAVAVGSRLEEAVAVGSRPRGVAALDPYALAAFKAGVAEFLAQYHPEGDASTRPDRRESGEPNDPPEAVGRTLARLFWTTSRKGG